MPDCIRIVLPFSSVALKPSELIATDLITPVVPPSALVTVLPIRLAAWLIEVSRIRLSRWRLVLIACSTPEKVASCDICWLASIGSVGSWFFIWATSSLRKLS